MQLPVIAEGLAESANLMHAHVFDMVLQLGRPEVNTVHGATVGLIVGPESSEAIPAGHALLRRGRVELLELLIDRWVEDIILRHVVEHEGHLVQGEVIALLVMTVIDELP